MRTWVFFGPALAALSSCAPPNPGPTAPSGAEKPRTTIAVPVSRAAPALPEKTKPWNLPVGSVVDRKIDLGRGPSCRSRRALGALVQRRKEIQNPLLGSRQRELRPVGRRALDAEPAGRHG